MDVASGSIVIGVLSGTMLGNARLVPGVLGNALYLDGQMGTRVEYGVHTQGCFFDPDRCTDGITISLWLKLHEYPTQFLAIFDSGGCKQEGTGFCFNLQPSAKMRFEFLRRSGYDSCEFSAPSLYDWHFFVMTVYDSTITVYIDGNDERPDSVCWPAVRVAPFAVDALFYIGAWAAGGTGGHVTLDELSVWYDVLDPMDLLLVHMHGILPWWWHNHAKGAALHLQTSAGQFVLWLLVIDVLFQRVQLAVSQHCIQLE